MATSKENCCIDPSVQTWLIRLPLKGGLFDAFCSIDWKRCYKRSSLPNTVSKVELFDIDLAKPKSGASTLFSLVLILIKYLKMLSLKLFNMAYATPQDKTSIRNKSSNPVAKMPFLFNLKFYIFFVFSPLHCTFCLLFSLLYKALFYLKHWSVKKSVVHHSFPDVTERFLYLYKQN